MFKPSIANKIDLDNSTLVGQLNNLLIDCNLKFKLNELNKYELIEMNQNGAANRESIIQLNKIIPQIKLNLKSNEFNRIQSDEPNKLDPVSIDKLLGYLEKYEIIKDKNEFSTCSTCGILKSKAKFIKDGKFCSQICAEPKIKKKIKKKKKQLNKQQFNQIHQQSAHISINQLSIENVQNLKSSMINNLQKSNHNEEVQQINASKVQNKFSWSKYLKETNSISAPLKCFKINQTYNNKPNYFKPGMKLEAIDPLHPSLFCVATVVEVCGFRMRIHLDKYSDQFDFWVNCDSPFIFHVGFCAKTDRKLQPPKNYKQFDWSTYLQQEKAKAAPKHFFYWYNKQIQIPAGFKKGMKLEAIDKTNSFLVCVATINDVLGEWLLIHFDGYSDDSRDYWTEYNSPRIHSIDWHKNKKNITFSPPKNYPNAFEFDWESYLKETNSNCIISNLFKARPANSFKPGMKLEVVDRRNPRYLRVSTIVARTSYSIKIHFDDWPEKFDFWIEDNSSDLHPINWSLQANNNYLEGPLNQLNEQQLLKNCPTLGCKGIGHLKNSKFLHHNSPSDCPYSEINFNYKKPNRLADLIEDDHSETNSFVNSYSSTAEMNNFSNSRPVSSMSDNRSQSSNNSSHLLSPSAISEQELIEQLNSFVNTLNAEQILQQWDCEKVKDFVSILPECFDYAQLFKNERIDGQSFLLLTQSDLINLLNIKKAPAIKIYHTICQIRKNLVRGSSL